MAETTAIILDPDAAHRTTGRLWQACQRQCLRELAPAEIRLADGIDGAREAAREAALGGFGKIVAVGDTGTAHGVLNGVMTLAESHRRSLKVGVLSMHRPQEWSRTLGLPRRLRRQLQVLKAGHVQPFDVGRVEYHDRRGRPLTRHFLNGAGFGLQARLRHDWRNGRRDWAVAVQALGGALWRALQQRDPQVRLESDGREIYRGPWVAGVIMVGRYYPRFGEVAPEADPVDGLLDLVGVTGPFRLRALPRLAGWLPGRGQRGERFAAERATSYHVTDITGPVYLEVDGLPAGTLPATFSVVPRAVPMIVPAVPVKLVKPGFDLVPELRHGGLAAGNLKVRQRL